MDQNLVDMVINTAVAVVAYFLGRILKKDKKVK
jgi:hypothetical protein